MEESKDKTKSNKLVYIIFWVLLFVLILEIGIIVGKSIYSKKKIKEEILSLNDSELVAMLIKYNYVFETPYTEEELASYTPEEQLKLIGDDYAQYLNKEDFEKEKDEQDLKFIGLGFKSLEIADGYFEVVRILPNTPVEEAGIKPGDRIVKIDGISLKDMPILDAMNLLEEKKEEDTVFTIQRDDTFFDTTIRRRLIKGTPVVADLLKDGIGYIKISHFSNNLEENFIKALSALMSDNMTKLILDLRGNPGGAAHQVVPIASALLDNSIKKLYTIKYRNVDDQKFKRDRDMMFSGPLVILCNERTASASEVLISILKDYDRCTTVGKKTYGKQVSQEVFNLNSSNTLFLSTGICLPPKENIYNKIGINPDYEVSLDNDLEDKQLTKAIEILKEIK